MPPRSGKQSHARCNNRIARYPHEYHLRNRPDEISQIGLLFDDPVDTEPDSPTVHMAALTGRMNWAQRRGLLHILADIPWAPFGR